MPFRFLPLQCFSSKVVRPTIVTNHQRLAFIFLFKREQRRKGGNIEEDEEEEEETRWLIIAAGLF